MFTPLTIAIFSGALSPSCLEGQRYVSERLQQSVRKLMNLPGSLDGLTDQLKGILSDWQGGLPGPPFPFFSVTNQPSFHLSLPLSFFFLPRLLFPTLMLLLSSAACG